jgi:hypothetical protein
VSPSARKNPNLKPIHDDKHDFPALKTDTASHEEPAPTKTVMKDDEGTPADVGASIKAAAVRTFSNFFLLSMVCLTHDCWVL